MVASPVFFPEELWVREPKGWAPNIVRGRGEDLTQAEGLRIQREGLCSPLRAGTHPQSRRTQAARESAVPRHVPRQHVGQMAIQVHQRDGVELIVNDGSAGHSHNG